MWSVIFWYERQLGVVRSRHRTEEKAEAARVEQIDLCSKALGSASAAPQYQVVQEVCRLKVGQTVTR